MTVLKLALRGIRSSLGRLALTTIAIITGVGFVSGAFILSDSLEDTFVSLFEDVNSSVDARVLPADLEFGDDIIELPESLAAEVASLPEVGSVAPSVTIDPGDVYTPFVVVNSEGEAIIPQGPPIITFSLFEDSNEIDLDLLVEGTFPVGEDQFAIDPGYAKAAGVEVGETVTVQTLDGEQDFTLSGLIDLPSAGNYYVVFDFPTAQKLYGKEDKIDSITLSRATGVSTEDMIAAVQNMLPDQAKVLNQEEVIAEDTAGFEQVVSIIRYVLLGFAFISLFVSLFIIYNTFAILINQRLRQIGMLRAIGATKRQIKWGVILEATVVALIGSILGVLFGLVVAYLIKLGFQAGGGFPETDTIVKQRTIIISIAVGLIATLVSAFVPAIMAGKVSPIEAMRNTISEGKTKSKRVYFGSLFFLGGMVLLLLGMFGSNQEITAILVELGFGAILVFVGVALLSYLFAGKIVDFLGKPMIFGSILLLAGIALPVLIFTIGDSEPSGFSSVIFMIKLIVAAISFITGASIILSALKKGKSIGFGGSAAGLEGNIARQNASRSPQRTAATATALTIGIALVSTVGVVGESLKTTFSDTLSRSIAADLFVFAPEGSSFTDEIANEMKNVDGLESIASFRSNEFWIAETQEQIESVEKAIKDDDPIKASTLISETGTISENTVNFSAYQTETGTDIINLGYLEGASENIGVGGITVFKDTAEERSIELGEKIFVIFSDNRAESLEVVGIFEDNSVLNTPWIIDTALYEKHITASEDLFVGAKVSESANYESVKSEVTKITDEYGGVETQDPAELQETLVDQIDGLISLINYLLAFALFVAFIGVINTIALSVIERTREIGLLRAVGMTRKQIKASIRWEAVLVCIFGTLLGIGLGVVFAWAAISAIPDDIISRVSIPYENYVFMLILTALAGMLAALLPARRAAKMNVLKAISSGE